MSEERDFMDAAFHLGALLGRSKAEVAIILDEQRKERRTVVEGMTSTTPVMTEGMFTSRTDDWPTPQATFDALNAEFGGFDLDAAASPDNAKCPEFWTEDDNALFQIWRGKVFLNPPYGKPMPGFMQKARQEIANGNASVVVCVVPCRTDTRFWHDEIMAHASEVRLIKGRLNYGDGDNQAPFPSAVVVFTPEGGPALVRSCDRLGASAYGAEEVAKLAFFQPQHNVDSERQCRGCPDCNRLEGCVDSHLNEPITKNGAPGGPGHD